MPNESRLIVVVTSTPAITLTIIDRLALLQDPYETILIPSAVHKELVAGVPNRQEAPQLAVPPWVKTV